MENSVEKNCPDYLKNNTWDFFSPMNNNNNNWCSKSGITKLFSPCLQLQARLKGLMLFLYTQPQYAKWTVDLHIKDSKSLPPGTVG